MRTIGTQLKRGTLYDTSQEVLLEPLHALFAPFFQQYPELKGNITLPRNTLNQLLGLFINANYVTKTFTAFTIWENISRRNMENREVEEIKMFDVAHVLVDADDNSLKEELETRKHFLVDSEMENGRYRV